MLSKTIGKSTTSKNAVDSWLVTTPSLVIRPPRLSPERHVCVDNISRPSSLPLFLFFFPFLFFFLFLFLLLPHL